MIFNGQTIARTGFNARFSVCEDTVRIQTEEISHHCGLSSKL